MANTFSSIAICVIIQAVIWIIYLLAMKACKKSVRPERSTEKDSSEDKPDDIFTLIVKVTRLCVNRKQRQTEVALQEETLLDNPIWTEEAGYGQLKWYSGFIFMNCDMLTIGRPVYH